MLSLGAAILLPSVHEIRLYLRNNGVRRSVLKGVTAYVVGRQRWYLTQEDLTTYIGQPIRGNGFQFRRARLGEVPHMKGLMERMPEAVLRRWCGPGYFFFVTWKDGEAVSYRCLSTYVHPGVREFARLAPHQVFMVDEYTIPKYRRRGITRQMAFAMAPWVVGQGFREVLGIHRTDNHDTVAAARAKGVTEALVVAKHTLKNAAVPIVTITGLQFGTLLGGAVVTETVFAWPGIGRLAIQSIYNRDYPVVQCTVFISAVLFIVINFVVDLIYGLLDPRVRSG